MVPYSRFPGGNEETQENIVVMDGLKSDTVSVSQALPLYGLAGLFLYVISVGLLPEGT
jgi:hypothetical protein